MAKEQPEKNTVTMMCPNLRCRKILMVPGVARGRRVRCSYCGMTIMVPQKNLNLLSRIGYNNKPSVSNSPDAPDETT